MNKRTITATDLWNLPRVGEPAPSPDGKRLAVPVTTHSLETDEPLTRLWIVPADGGDPRPLTSMETSSNQTAWSPDGRELLFLRKPGGHSRTSRKHPDKPQLWHMPVDGGEPVRLTDFPLGVAEARYMPNGKTAVLLVPLLGEAPTPDGTARLLKKRKKDRVNIHATENRLFRFWDRWLTDGIVHHFFLFDLQTKEWKDLTPRLSSLFPLMSPNGSWDLSPDGKEIAFSACLSKPPYKKHLRWGVFKVAIPKGKPTLISDRKLIASGPRYSPDGSTLVWGFHRDEKFYADRTRLTRYDRRTKKETVLTEAWNLSAGAWRFGASSHELFLQAEVDGKSALYRMDIRKPGTPKELVRGGWYHAPRPAGGKIYTIMDSLTTPPEVFALDRNGKNRKKLTSFTAPILRNLSLGKTQNIRFKGAEGAKVQMFVIHPPTPTRGKPPLVHMIHGGPHGVFGDQWHWRWNAQAIAAGGYLVAHVNFHGSTSWGQDFAASIRGAWGDKPLKDIDAATDELLKRKMVDPRRMAVTGGSYGGYLTSWICSQTSRYACAICHAGVNDFQIECASDATYGWDRAWGGTPLKDLEKMDRYNPMRYAANFQTPMLVIHGMRDYRVPYAQALALYNVLQEKGVPARLLVYPDESHWILKANNNIRWYAEFDAWLKRWLRKKKK